MFPCMLLLSYFLSTPWPMIHFDAVYSPGMDVVSIRCSRFVFALFVIKAI